MIKKLKKIWSNPESQYEVEFKTISVRGKLAFGAICIEKYIDEKKLNEPWLQILVDTIWEFTSENDSLRWLLSMLGCWFFWKCILT